MNVFQVQTTVETRQQASQLARQLVQERLAACVQVLGPLESHYHWQGRLEQAQEWLLLVKTTAEALPRLQQRLVQLHPYDVPQVIALPIQAGHPPYLQWVEENTRVEGSA